MRDTKQLRSRLTGEQIIDFSLQCDDGATVHGVRAWNVPGGYEGFTDRTFTERAKATKLFAGGLDIGKPEDMDVVLYTATIVDQQQAERSPRAPGEFPAKRAQFEQVTILDRVGPAEA